jgi:O-antigen/teichoic acid export membrane protein
MLASAMSTVLYPKFAAGEDLSVARSLRGGLFAVACLSAGLAAVSPVLLPLAFGTGFREALPMVFILLAAAVPLAGVGVLAAIFTAGHRVLQAGVSEIVALAVTVTGLVLLLPSLGGVGAAIVSLAAYSLNFTWLVLIARHDHGGRLRDYLFIRRAEIADLRHLARRLLTVRRRDVAQGTP